MPATKYQHNQRSSANFQPAAIEPVILKPGETIAKIIIGPGQRQVFCLLPNCGFMACEPQGHTRDIVMRLRGMYRDHRKLKHPELRGRSGYDYDVREGVVCP